MPFSSSGMLEIGTRLIPVLIAFFMSNDIATLNRGTSTCGESSIHSDSNEVIGIAAVYLVSTVTLMLATERLLSAIPTKLVYLGSILLFQVGSAVCFLSSSGLANYGGRVAATFAALLMCNLASYSVTQIPYLFERPVALTLIGIIVGLMISSGPPFGILLEKKLTQANTVAGTFLNWCLYINSPVTAAVIWCAFMEHNFLDSNLKQHDLHPVTDILQLGSIVLLLFGFQWTGLIKSFHDGGVRINLGLCLTVLAIFCMFAILRANGYPASKVDPAKQSRLGANKVVVCIAGLLLVGVNYLPLWSQSNGHNANEAGIRILPFVVSVVTSLAVLTISGNIIWPIFVAIVAPLVYGLSLYGGIESFPQHDYPGRQMMYGASLGAIIRYFAYMSEATEFLDNIAGFIEAAHHY
ncbi:MFS general substrate transporter [Mycena venus]|uniref:MFS general substrate transporter n=1 Tax=Mycena venus TaxID=2733690 RepID=A0A8H7DC99_9AGAR|nr:MFS general substrate transporter [Mycena venus]